MNILVTGGTGFIGSMLTPRLAKDGHEVTILSRSAQGTEFAKSGVNYLNADPTLKGSWQKVIKHNDVIINLAGASIFSKWTPEHKIAIRKSRVSTTKNLVEAIEPSQDRALTLLSSSAVGYYGIHGNETLSEEDPAGNDFLAQIASESESEALKAKAKGVRVVLLRIGIVLEKNGGALKQMVPIFKKFLGGPLGSGNQWFSWIHPKDLIEAITFLIKHPQIGGPVNLCAPNPVMNKDLAKSLGKALRRPSFIPAPGFMIRLVLGEVGSVVLTGQKVLPRRLLESGFIFRYPYIDNALHESLK